MGMGRPRSLACVLAACALFVLAAPAVPAAAKKRVKAHPFGSRLLGLGTAGKDVRFLQRALTRLGVPTAVDGAFGKGTYRSVRTFEQQHGWPVDGRISRRDGKESR